MFDATFILLDNFSQRFTMKKYIIKLISLRFNFRLCQT
jgi:hypothetical protein